MHRTWKNSWNSSQCRWTTSSGVNTTTRNIPVQFRKLYEALNEVKDGVVEQTGQQRQLSLSRLQLALRGLESDVPITRVAGW